MSALIKLVSRLSAATLQVEDFESTLQEASEEVAQALLADFASVLTEKGGHRFEYRFDRHGRVPTSFAISVSREESAGRRAQIVTAASPQGAGLGEAGLRCAVVTPVPVSKEESLTLTVGFGEPGRVFLAEDLSTLEAVASVLALGASRRSFQELALLDPGTRLYNRRWLEAVLAAEVERARRYRQPFALLLLDVDSFKRINDLHGHPMGDRVLSAIARVLTDCVRSCDAAVRLGGDEFALLLPATTAGSASRIARRVLERVRELSFGDPREPVRVTLSGGVAMVEPDSTPESLLSDADRALYDAKEAGRDSVVVPENTPVFDEGIVPLARARRRQAGI